MSEWLPERKHLLLHPRPRVSLLSPSCAGALSHPNEFRPTVNPSCGRFPTKPAGVLSLPEACFSRGDFSGHQKAPGESWGDGTLLRSRRVLSISLWDCWGPGCPALWEDPVFTPLLVLH